MNISISITLCTQKRGEWSPAEAKWNMIDTGFDSHVDRMEALKPPGHIFASLNMCGGSEFFNIVKPPSNA